MADEDTEITIELAKELIEEVKILKERIENLELENFSLMKAADDPTVMMRKQGWQVFATPHADETFDPLNRDTMDVSSSVGPFSGSGDMIAKSRYDEIREWEDAEREMRQ
tara:strand:- start:465 stop:794 length:330 start_codon:yes stop_codon:yes gene_type:complete